jgi:hypothetical protein
VVGAGGLAGAGVAAGAQALSAIEKIHNTAKSVRKVFLFIVSSILSVQE